MVIVSSCERIRGQMFRGHSGCNTSGERLQLNVFNVSERDELGCGLVPLELSIGTSWPSHFPGVGWSSLGLVFIK